ncbi:MAG: Ppx/GppA family phosphatase [Thermoleophilia bacterium]|nr:Ppx/GppA family phosphatase [Thermoleophilia bacterium]
MTRVAVVDLGTNSTRLLVADVDGDGLEEVERRLAITRLGEGVDADRVLLPESIARVAGCLEGYRNAIDELGAERALAYATSAVRDAANGGAFLTDVGRAFGLETRLLSGDEEAALTFRGATHGRTLEGLTAVVDLGGGSTEIALGDETGIRFSTSLDVGCVRLTERFACDDPLGTCEREALVVSIRSLLLERLPADPLPLHGIAVAGTAATLATLHLGLAEEDPALVHGHLVPTPWLFREALRLSATPADELRRRPGLLPERAPVIGAGALALAEIAGFFELPALEVSERDILHGVALELTA